MDVVVITAIINGLLFGCIVFVIVAKHKSLSVKILSLLVLVIGIAELIFGVYFRNFIVRTNSIHFWIWVKAITRIANLAKVIVLLILGSVLVYKRKKTIQAGKNTGQETDK